MVIWNNILHAFIKRCAIRNFELCMYVCNIARYSMCLCVVSSINTFAAS